MSEKIPPNNLEAERSVLGAGLLSKDALADAVEILKPEDFYDAANREIFTVMYDMYRDNKPVDIVTVCNEMNRRKVLPSVGGHAYVTSLSADVPSAVNVAEYARIVADKAALRTMIVTAESIRERGFDAKMDPREILNYAEQEIFRIAQQRQSRDYAPIGEVLLRDLQIINEAAKNKGQVRGVPTGFKTLDDVTGGLQKSALIIVAARPAMGKTAFALNIAQNAAVRGGKSVLLFSLEMSKEELGNRLLAMEARVDAEKLKKGTLDRSEWESLMLAIDVMSTTTINIDDTPNLTIFEIKNKCRRMKASAGLDLVVIDYLQLMNADSRIENRQQQISMLTRNLKLMARELDCPVIVLSQLSRGPEQRDDKRPKLSDLRESGSIEQDADIVMFLYRDEYYNSETEKRGICEVNIAKHRSGQTRRVELTWVDRYTRFSDKA